MMHLESTTKELSEARKIIYEGDDKTKRTFLSILTTLICLMMLFILSIFGTADVWECEIDSMNPKHDYICKELRRSVNCQTISGPIRAEVLLSINEEVKASALAICPWEIAISELRVVFTLLSVLCIGTGIYAIRKENKKSADLFSQGAIFFSVVLLIAAYFDWLSIRNSDVNNYNLCNLQDEFQVEANVKGERIECTYGFYYATILASIISAISMIWSSLAINDWKQSLPADNL